VTRKTRNCLPSIKSWLLLQFSVAGRPAMHWR
jgi:hypothetical protein